MSTQAFSLFQRRAIWEAHSKKCAYCGEPIRYRDVEIDHVLPEALANKPDEWNRVRADCGLPSGFALRGLGNLVPSCRPCNQRKSDTPLPLGRAVIEISRALKKAPQVETLIAQFRSKDAVDKVRLQIELSLAAGKISEHEVAELITSLKRKQNGFALTRSVFGSKSIMEISLEDINYILDESVQFSPGMEEALRLVSDGGDQVYVRTLREFREAMAMGYYAISNAEMQTAYAYFERPLDVLDAVMAAGVADRSYIDNPHVGVTKLAIMPAEALAGYTHMTNDPAFSDLKNASKQLSIQDVVDCGSAKIVEIGKDLVAVDTIIDHRTFIFEIMRADFNGDGIQDIMIHHGIAALHGSYRSGSTVWLTRLDTDAMFTRNKRSPPQGAGYSER